MYKALLNGELFFTTEIQDDDYKLTQANISKIVSTAGSFVFSVPSCNTAYGTFHRMIDYIEVFRDTKQIFYGRVSKIVQKFNTDLEITCEGMLAVFNDSIFRPVLYDARLHGLVSAILTSHNSQVEADKQIQVGNLYVDDAECYRDYQNIETTLSRINDLVESYGGYIVIRHENNTNYLDWYKNYVTGNTQALRIGENILSLTKELPAEQICTVLTPQGAMLDDGTRLDIKSVNNNLDYVEASASDIQKYGYIHKTKIWDDVTVASILKSKAEAWVAACCVPIMSITVTAADLSLADFDVDSFEIGQKIKTISEYHEINDFFDCNRVDIDLLHPELSTLNLGTQKAGFVQSNRMVNAETNKRIEKIAQSYAPKTLMEEAIENATELITGNDGGYVIIHDSNADTYPDEILVMDTANINTAVNVWRWNKNGLGHSSSGYAGTYGTAITQDGKIVADYITTGTMSADRIRAGTIASQVSNTSSWNLTTGLFSTKNAEIGGWLIDSSSIHKAVPASGARYNAYMYAPSNLTSTTKAFGIEHYNANNAIDATPFYVRYDGYLHSTVGDIGGWTINSDGLYNGNTIKLYTGSTFVDRTVVHTVDGRDYTFSLSYVPSLESGDLILAKDGTLITSTVYLQGDVIDGYGGTNIILKDNTFTQTIKLEGSTGRIYCASRGVANADSYGAIYLGNNKAKTTAGHSTGDLVLYGYQSYYHSIYAVDTMTANRFLRLPDKSGTIALTSDVPTNYPYVSSYDTSGNWKRLKYSNGVQVLWCIQTVQDIDITTAWGYGYEGRIGWWQFPWAFSETPSIQASIQYCSHGVILEHTGNGTQAGTQTYWAYRPTSQTGVSLTIGIVAIGISA